MTLTLTISLHLTPILILSISLSLSLSKVDHLVTQLEKVLDELTLLKGYVESEALVFHKLQLFAPALSKYIDIVRLIVSEITSMRENLNYLVHNKTQAKFVEVLRPILGNLGADIEIINFIISEHLTTTFHIRIYPNFVYTLWDRYMYYATLFVDFLVDGRINQPTPSSTSSPIFPTSYNHPSSSSSSASSHFPTSSYHPYGQSNYPPSSLPYSSSSSSSYPCQPLSKPSSLSPNDYQLELEFDKNCDHISQRYFDSHSKSRKIKSMHDRRTFFQNIPPPPPPEEEFFLDSHLRGERTDRTARTAGTDLEEGIKVIIKFNQMILCK